MITLADALDFVKDELGTDIVGLLGAGVDTDIERWLDEGQRRLGYYIERDTTLSWVTDATEVALPSDFCEMDTLLLDNSMTIPAYRTWNKTLFFTNSNGANSDGSARLLYLAHPKDFADNGDVTELPEVGDNAICAFAIHRAYKKIASSRAEYKRYATIMQQNGVEMQDLAAMSEQYFAEFLDAKDNLPLRNAGTYFGD